MISKEMVVSIIVPCYNVESFLDRCVKSIVSQTYQNLEIILVDDGSTDSTPEMCDVWAQKDDRIKVIHKANDGLANARNSGIEMASGEYVMLTDSDDYIEPDMVEYLLNLSLKYDADVSRCGFYYEYENGAMNSVSDNTEEVVMDYTERMIDLVSAGNISGVAWNKLYRRDVIKSHPYDKADGCSEDIMHNFRVYKDIAKLVCCNVPKYHYIIRDGSITNSKFGDGAFDIIRAREIMNEFFKGDEQIYSSSLEWYIKTALVVLQGSVANNVYTTKYYVLRKRIRKYFYMIIFSHHFKLRYKIKFFVLCCFPCSINKLIGRKRL